MRVINIIIAQHNPKG